ncbi:MAG TPA: periplasmic heavy metal sensor [Chitinophagaceae bacterium]|nr:periplasmic heavy metal sensor [Chitinophagaceae bacterium]
MSTTSRNKTLLFIIAVLLLTNIAVLVYFLGNKRQDNGKPPRSQRGGLSEMLQKEVGFNEDQVAKYKELKVQQWETIRPMFDQMRKAKDSLFRLMSDSTANDSVINKAAESIAAQQKALDLQAFNHFKRVRELCSNPDQQVKYDSAILRMFRKMGKPARRGENNKEEKSK